MLRRPSLQLLSGRPAGTWWAALQPALAASEEAAGGNASGSARQLWLGIRRTKVALGKALGVASAARGGDGGGGGGGGVGGGVGGGGGCGGELVSSSAEQAARAQRRRTARSAPPVRPVRAAAAAAAADLVLRSRRSLEASPYAFGATGTARLARRARPRTAEGRMELQPAPELREVSYQYVLRGVDKLLARRDGPVCINSPPIEPLARCRAAHEHVLASRPPLRPCSIGFSGGIASASRQSRSNASPPRHQQPSLRLV